MKIFRILLAVASITFALSSCTKNNPDPVWLEISEWELSDSSDPLNPVGELTHNFSDAWVYVDNELIGVFELPCKIPLIQEGAKDVKIYPAVWNNGISATKKIYPFVEVYETSIELNKNQVITLNPTTRYKDGVQFWIEDFETNVFQIGNGSSAVQIQKVNDPIILQSFNGDFFGRISLNETDNTWSGSTLGQLVLPKGQDIYLEIDYHTTNDLVTGVLGASSNGIATNPNIQLNQQADSEVLWKKIYIELREIVSSSTEAEYFEISFDAVLDEGDTHGEINIDNIKVVHF